jgi:SAM-dependent methyltransferase
LESTLATLRSSPTGAPHFALARLTDAEWLELNCAVAPEANPLPELLPDVPRDAVRQIFTARGGRVDFEEAFAFYVHARALWRRWTGTEASPRPLLDFGCGWGRILRFWLRDVPAEDLWGVDCFSYAVNWFRRTRNPAHVLHIDPEPPLGNDLPAFSMIQAFSVFSHLHEDLARRWIRELAARLRPGGLLVVTTRGRRFLDELDSIRAAPPDAAHIQRTLGAIPAPEALRQRLAAGEFVFVQTHDGDGELRGEHYGEAWIPRGWAEAVASEAGLRLVAYDEAVPGVDQPVIAYRREP